MNLEVGMYVRTKNGAIAKIEQIVDDEIHFNIKPIFSNGECLGYNWVYIKDVVKASNNIIDLIEVGDYVNGSEVTSIEENGWLGFGDNDWYIPNSGGIKSIVTKEQFESMSYKISLEG